jgi:hypothetical protein
VEHSVLEIVELENGDVVLQQVNSGSKPLLNIQFSDESKAYLDTFGNLKMLVAKAMIQAGVQAFSEYMHDQADTSDATPEAPSAMLH